MRVLLGLVLCLLSAAALADSGDERHYAMLVGALWQQQHQPPAGRDPLVNAMLQASLQHNIARWRADQQRAAADASALAELMQAPPQGWPVAGRVVRDYGETDDFGQPQTGVMLEAKAGSGIFAPENGKVAYVGEIRGYGLVTILETERGDYLLLGGFGQTDALVGQKIAGGEAIGRLSGGIVGKPRPERLYFERRRKGQTVPPLM